MAQNELEFSCLKDSYLGELSPNEVSQFYYDIGVESELNNYPYIWDDDMKDYCVNNNLVIEECKEGSLPQSVNENEIYFTECDYKNVKQDKAIAFLRHLRNAFAHYRIVPSNSYYCMRDEHDKKTTMIGKIDKELFQGLIQLYFKQKTEAEEKHNEYLYPRL